VIRVFAGDITGVVTASARRRASASHRRRAKQKGLVRVEVQAHRRDTPFIRALAAGLRGDTARARRLRTGLTDLLGNARMQSALELCASDLDDSTFEGVFDERRTETPRAVKL
jgi:hypothetical protein